MVKTVDDYLDAVQAKFPYLCKDDIKTILEFGLLRYLKANRLHADVLLKNTIDDNMLIHCGALGLDGLKHWFRWHIKWRMKERALYRFRGQQWDGYYYIGLNDEQHKIVQKQRKTKTFKNVYLVKIKNELHHEKWVKHIWRIPYPANCGWKFFVTSFSSDKAEFVEENNYEKYHQCFLGRYNNGSESVDNATNSSNECT